MNLRDVKLIKAFPYETARLYRHEGEMELEPSSGRWRERTNTIPRAFVRELENELVKQAEWKTRDNKTLYVFDYAHERWAVSFHDFTATFVSWRMWQETLPANLQVPGGKL